MEFFITNPEEKWTTAKLKLINKELVPYLFPNIDIPTYFDSHQSVLIRNQYLRLIDLVLDTILDLIYFFVLSQDPYPAVVVNYRPYELFDVIKTNVVYNIETKLLYQIIKELVVASEFTSESHQKTPQFINFITGRAWKSICFIFLKKDAVVSHLIYVI